MPQTSWNDKRDREYEELKEEFHEEHRYPGREEEVAARIVNKQRSEQSETKEARKDDRDGKSPDRDLPIRNYDNLTVDEVVDKLRGLSAEGRKKIADYERSHKNRGGVLDEAE